MKQFLKFNHNFKEEFHIAQMIQIMKMNKDLNLNRKGLIMKICYGKKDEKKKLV